jgi:hypothetical protein
VTTLTNNQICKTDGTNVICDSTTPTVSASNFLGIGTTAPASLLSVYGGGLAVGTYAATTAASTGNAIFSGIVGIGTASPTANVALDMGNTTGAVIVPIGTTGQQPTGVNGMLRYNSSVGKFQGYQQSAWQDILTSGGLGSAITLGTAASNPNPYASGSDTQTGFYTTGVAGHVDVTSQNTQIVDISASGLNVVTGSVGIGTTSAASKLDVNGGVTIGTGYAGLSAAPTSGLIVQGNVGIGTTSPSGNLDVHVNTTVIIIARAMPWYREQATRGFSSM